MEIIDPADVWKRWDFQIMSIKDVILHLSDVLGINYEISLFASYIPVAIINIMTSMLLALTFYPITIAAGIFLRGLFIRLYATLLYFYLGISNSYNNWYETLWLLDFRHPPELLPGSILINDRLSVKGCIDIIKRSKLHRTIFLNGLLVIAWYIPAVMWRWALKSTLWLWWPLVFLSKPPFSERNIKEIRDISSLRVYGIGKWIPMLAIIIISWLLTAYIPLDKIKLITEFGGEPIKKAFEKLLELSPPPPIGLRQVSLWGVSLLSIILWWLSDRFNIMHRKVLEEEDALDTLPKSRQELFLIRANNLERWHMFRVVGLIFLGYSYILYLATIWYPNESMYLIPRWLAAWL